MPRLVRVNSLGLAIPPQRLDCLGEECPVAEKLGHCFVDGHHLYFRRTKFSNSELRSNFRKHPFNQIRLSRCQHSSAWPGAIHSKFDETPIPRDDIMQRFLEEAELLQQLGVMSIKSDGLLQSIFNEDAPRNVLRRREEDWYETEAALQGLLKQARVECEVVRPFLAHRTEQLPHAVGALLLSAA